LEKSPKSPESPKSRSRLLPWLAVLAWAMVLFGLSSIPGSDIPTSSIPSADKLVHISLYAVLGLFCFRALQASFVMTDSKMNSKADRKVLIAAISMALFYGISDEVHQIWVPRRSPDPFDVAADLTGGIIGASFGAWRLARRRSGVRRGGAGTMV
jgi:VanZ family protein